MDKKQKKFYGRRKGKQLTDNQIKMMSDVFPSLELKLPLIIDSKFKQVCLDIGFGTGINLNSKIQNNADVFFVGAEPFVNGIAQFLNYLPRDFYENVAIYNDDILEIWNEFNDEFFDKIDLLYPDPWPKARHEKRRFISVENLNQMSRILKTNGTIDIVSDISPYIELLRENLKEIKNLQIIYDLKEPYDYWTTTKYEQKALREGRVPEYITIKKTA